MLQLGINLWYLYDYQANSLRIITENCKILVNIKLFNIIKEPLLLDYILNYVG